MSVESIIVSYSELDTRDYGKVYQRRKQAGIDARAVLGGCCARCQIVKPLEWDHIEDDGLAVTTAGGRRRKPGTSKLYREWLSIIRTGTSAVLQLLCPNCNQLKKLDRAEFDRPPTYGMLS